MKRLIAFLFLISAFSASAAVSYTYKATLVVTAVPPVKATLDADGDTRRFTNNTPANAGKFLQTTNTLQATASNVWAHASLYGFTNINAVKIGTNNTALPTNTVVFETTIDHFVTLTSLSNWCTITYATNTLVSGWTAVRIPHTNEQLTVQTTIVSGVMGILNDPRGTNNLAYNAPLFTNVPHSLRVSQPPLTNQSIFGGTNRPNDFLATNGGLRNVWASNLLTTNLTGTSLLLTNVSNVDSNSIVTNLVRLNGNLILGTNITALGGSGSNMVLTNIFWLNGNLGGLSNGVLTGTRGSNMIVHSTNGYLSNFIAHTFTATNFSAPGSGTGSQRIGDDAVASGDGGIAFGVRSTASGENSVSVGTDSTASGENAAALGDFALATQLDSLAIGVGAKATNVAAMAIGFGAISSNVNSTAIGQQAITTADSQIRIGISTDHVSIPGEIRDLVVTNSAFTGTNRIDGGICLTVSNATGMANGDVLLNFSPNVSDVELSGNTATINICGVKNGANGRDLWITKTNVYNLVVRNYSGAAGTAASERVVTGTGADVTFTNMPCTIHLRYRSNLSAWKLMDHEN